MPENPDSTTVHSVLFVCSANQCRSPMAMALLRDMVIRQSKNPDDWRIESAGVWAMPNLIATSGAMICMTAINLSLEDHRSQPVTESLLEKFKLVLCMSEEHKRTLQRNFPEHASKIYLISEMTGENSEVSDPVGGSGYAYVRAVEVISGYLTRGYERIKALSR